MTVTSPAARTDASSPLGGGPDADRYARFAALAIIVVTTARAGALALNVLNLGEDEAQYWYWSLTPEFGYFSKPPLIAWLIGATSGVFGSEEWAIRLGAPLCHAGASWALFVLGRDLYDPRAGFWIALGYLTLPAVSLSSGLITTDAPLLFIWCVSLAVLARLLRAPAAPEAMLLGALIGLGLLAKYAMIYFAVGLGCLAAFRPDARAFALSRYGALIAGLAFLIVSPNLLWNVSHDFSTVSHTAANANWGAELFNVSELLKFLGDQFGVFGPLYFAALLAMGAGLALRRRRPSDADIFLWAFTLPPLAIVSVQAFLSRAHANWAAAAAPAAIALTTAWLLRAGRPGLLKTGVAAHMAVGIALSAFAAAPGLADRAGLSNAFKRARGWDDLGPVAATTLARQGADAVVTDNREIMSALLYYTRNFPIPVRMYAPHPAPRNHYEAFSPYEPAPAETVLIITRTAQPPDGLAARARLIGVMTSYLGGGQTRALYFYLADPIDPAASP